MAFRTTYSQELVAWNLPTSPFFKFLKVKRVGIPCHKRLLTYRGKKYYLSLYLLEGLHPSPIHVNDFTFMTTSISLVSYKNNYNIFQNIQIYIISKF